MILGGLREEKKDKTSSNIFVCAALTPRRPRQVSLCIP